jgi:hypothetical protein
MFDWLVLLHPSCVRTPNLVADDQRIYETRQICYRPDSIKANFGCIPTSDDNYRL